MSESKSEQGGREKERVRKNALLLFSKPPIPGLVKTRLTVLKDGVFQPEVASAVLPLHALRCGGNLLRGDGRP